ncbi:MAG: type I DNA topoisomerase [Patescibacteria group bacterium]|nr:type I DNA topoisomerase [Patescibacteria group bacterium]
MNLVIVESPVKAKVISKFLGKKYKVLSSFGHIRDLPKSELGIDVENNFKPKYIIPTKARKTANALKKAAKEADLIILATDEDREGEAIAWHILYILTAKGKTKTEPKKHQRIVFHEITKNAIEKALANPREIDINLVNAQQARRALDRLVGYELSPFLWKKLVRGLSAGRVQSVAVRLIVDREREIETFKPDEYWSIEAELKTLRHCEEPAMASDAAIQSKDKITRLPRSARNDEKRFIAWLIKADNKKIPKMGIKNKKEADAILNSLNGAEYKIGDINQKEVKKYSLPPYKTSTLQQDASHKLGFSAKQAMRVAQQLYESGRITYHRTDSLNVSVEALASARTFIKNKLGARYIPDTPKFYKTKEKGAQEAHEAIRPTRPDREPAEIKKRLNPTQYKLYNLIWQRFIASQMNPAILDSVSVDVETKKTNSAPYIFRATGSVIKFDGFLKVYPIKLKESILPPLTKDELLKLIKLIPSQHFTLPPARYNDASLIKTLEECGIGRPSTYAPTISVIQDRGYVKKDEQKRFIPVEIGCIVIDLLKENFSQIVDIEFTAQIEKELDKIAEGKRDWKTMLKEFYEPFHKNLMEKYDKVEKKNFDKPTDKKCPKCGSPMLIKLGRFGEFYACSAFPKCKYAAPIIKSTGVKCPECKKGDIIERKTRKGKIFYSCSRYPKCKFALWDKPTGEKCPKCGSLMVEKGKSLKCSNKECS